MDYSARCRARKDRPATGFPLSPQWRARYNPATMHNPPHPVYRRPRPDWRGRHPGGHRDHHRPRRLPAVAGNGTDSPGHPRRGLAAADASGFFRCGRRLLHDIAPDAIKIGLIGSAALIPPLVRILRGFHRARGAGPGAGCRRDSTSAPSAWSKPCVKRLLPLIAPATPNRAEARRLAETNDAAPGGPA